MAETKAGSIVLLLPLSSCSTSAWTASEKGPEFGQPAPGPGAHLTKSGTELLRSPERGQPFVEQGSNGGPPSSLFPSSPPSSLLPHLPVDPFVSRQGPATVIKSKGADHTTNE